MPLTTIDPADTIFTNAFPIVAPGVPILPELINVTATLPTERVPDKMILFPV